MCGITGIVGRSDPERASRMRAMRGRLVHRGPDSGGEYVDEHAALGIRRLRIIDLRTGDQPLVNEHGTVWAVLNGEIYNYRELRTELIERGHLFRSTSDTEVIVHLYEEHGSFTVFFFNIGTTTWTRGTSTQVDLAACLEDKLTCNAQDASEAPFNSGWLSTTRYATHTQTSVAPKQLATFTYNVAVPAAQAAGTYRFNGATVKSDTAADIHVEGYYQDVTVPGVAAQPGAIVLSPDQNTPDTNTVSAGTTTNANRGAHTYTATISTTITATTVDIQLIRSGDYTPSTGAFRDGETDAGGTVVGDNNADLRSVGAAVIEVVNGVAITPATRVDAVTIPANRTITFTIDSTGVSDSVRPVVFVDADSDNQIDLNADNTASETAGVGGLKTWNAAEAAAANAAATVDGCVRQIDRVAKFFVLDASGVPAQCADPTAAGGANLYSYDANDIFTIEGAPSTMAAFETALNRGDGVTVGPYGDEPELQSQFDLTADGPTLTSCTAEKGSGAGSNDIKVTIDPATPEYDADSATTSSYYTGFRIQRAPVTGGTDEVADGTIGTYVTVATSTTDGDANTKTVWEYTDTDVSAGVYRYRCAGIVDGDTGPNATDATNESSVTPGAADATSPTSTDLFISVSGCLTGQLDTGDSFKVVFSEAMSPDSTGDVILFQDGDGTTMTLRCTPVNGTAAPTGEYEGICSFNTASETVKGPPSPRTAF